MTQVIARTSADKLFPIVAAASVVAKAERDAAMEALSAQCGHNLGSGYAPKWMTTEIREKYWNENHNYDGRYIGYY